MGNFLLEMQDLTVMRGDVLVLRDIDLNIKRGEAVALIGPNGAGKTTLFETVMGIHKVVKGDIRIEGSSIRGMGTERISRRISMIPQEFATFPFLTVLENLWISKNSSRRKAMTDEIFQIFPALQEKINQEASTLSGGQRQMLALGMGLARKCDILLLDEPTLGLSPLMTQRILNSIKEISDRFKLSVLISEQTPLVLNISDRVYVLEGGQIRIQGASQELKKDERIRKVYLGMAV